MPQFFIEKRLEENSEAVIRGSDARHIIQVLRLKVGDWILLSDGAGKNFQGIIADILPTSVRLTVGAPVERKEGSPPPVLALAVIKGDRFEWAIQKCVELGCRRIIPFLSERSVPQYTKDASSKKLGRWREIALSAAKQSGLPFKPEVEGVMTFQSLLSSLPGASRKILFYEGE